MILDPKPGTDRSTSGPRRPTAWAALRPATLLRPLSGRRRGRRARGRRDAARRRRLVDAAEPAPDRAGRRRLRLPPRRRHHPAARPALAPPARRRPRAVADLRRRRPRLDRRAAGPAAPLPGAVIYELHLGTFTPEGTLDAALGKLDHLRRPRRRPRRAAAGQRVQRHPQLGLRRRALVRRPRALRRAGGVPALRRRAATPPASASSRTSSTTTSGPSGNYLPLFGPYLSTEGAQHLGRLASTSTARARRRCAATSSTTCAMWLRGLPRRRAAARRRARAVDGPTERPPARGDGGRGRGASPPHLGRPADADRRVGPQRPAAGHPARGRRLRPRRPVERRLPPRRARRR